MGACTVRQCFWFAVACNIGCVATPTIWSRRPALPMPTLSPCVLAVPNLLFAAVRGGHAHPHPSTAVQAIIPRGKRIRPKAVGTSLRLLSCPFVLLMFRTPPQYAPNKHLLRALFRLSSSRGLCPTNLSPPLSSPAGPGPSAPRNPPAPQPSRPQTPAPQPSRPSRAHLSSYTHCRWPPSSPASCRPSPNSATIPTHAGALGDSPVHPRQRRPRPPLRPPPTSCAHTLPPAPASFFPSSPHPPCNRRLRPPPCNRQRRADASRTDRALAWVWVSLF